MKHNIGCPLYFEKIGGYVPKSTHRSMPMMSVKWRSCRQRGWTKSQWLSILTQLQNIVTESHACRHT